MIAYNGGDMGKIINLSGIDYSEMLKKWSPDGEGGDGGIGGKGGTGGAGGKNTWGVQASNGSNGLDGFNGSKWIGSSKAAIFVKSSENVKNDDCVLTEEAKHERIKIYLSDLFGEEQYDKLYGL